MLRLAAAVGGVALAAGQAEEVPLECKTYEVESYTGCTADGSANHCQTKLTAAGVTGYTLEGDDSLCRTTAEETSCGENPRPANLTACEAKYPIAISANETDPEDITLTPKTWAFYTITVDAATSMRHAQYSFEVPTAENNLSVAFLVGRCLLEVECGQCPPRAETLMSTEREPQICTLPDYCPGCDERVGQEGGCYEYTTEGAVTGYKRYTGTWSNLKRCEQEEAEFYIGVYPMDESFETGATVAAKLKVWWDASSAGPRVAPSLLAVLVAALAAAFA